MDSMYTVSTVGVPEAAESGEGVVVSRDPVSAMTAYWLEVCGLAKYASRLSGYCGDCGTIDKAKLASLCPDWTEDQLREWDGLIPYRYHDDGTLDLGHVKRWLKAVVKKWGKVSIPDQYSTSGFVIETRIWPICTTIFMTKTPIIDTQSAVVSYMRKRYTTSD